MKEAGWYSVILTTADGCSAQSDSLENRVLALPQGKPSINDLTNICSGVETTLIPDYEAGILYNFYYQRDFKTGGFLNNGTPQQDLTFKPGIHWDSTSVTYFVRKVNTNYQSGYPIRCISDEVQAVRLYKETYPP